MSPRQMAFCTLCSGVWLPWFKKKKSSQRTKFAWWTQGTGDLMPQSGAAEESFVCGSWRSCLSKERLCSCVDRLHAISSWNSLPLRSGSFATPASEEGREPYIKVWQASLAQKQAGVWMWVSGQGEVGRWFLVFRELASDGWILRNVVSNRRAK